MPIRCLLFDMDDTLIATTPIWRVAVDRLLADLGGQFDLALAAQHQGMNAYDVAKVIHQHYQPAKVTAEELGEQFRAYLLDAFSGEMIEKAGADEFIRRVHGEYPLVVASGSPLPAIKTALTRLGWADLFGAIISSEEVTRGKPHPDVFLEAAKRQHFPPKECLVLEDSLVGVQAGCAAGMNVFVMPSSDDPRIPAAATHAYAKISDITLADIATLE